MNEESKTAEAQWGFSGVSNTPIGSTATHATSNTTATEAIPKEKEAPPNIMPDTMKRRGFFEAVKLSGCPQQHLAALLKEHEQQAKDAIAQLELLTEQRMVHLRQRIAHTQERITELKERISAVAMYKESSDTELQILIQEREKEEPLLLQLQQKLTAVRLKLGEAKAGIIHKSLEDAELQVTTALNIQKTIYDETKRLNQQKFDDEKDRLAQLAACYQDLYNAYKKRYQRVDKHLTVLDVDGINPVTTKMLTNIGVISFGAAGFFFSTVAANTGFGNQDMLYFVLRGVFNAANSPMPAWLKIIVLLGLIGLVTLVGFGCNYLISRIKKKSKVDEVLNEVSLGATISKKLKQLEQRTGIKSYNWYGFWLQLIPITLVLGLIVLGIASKVSPASIGAINASFEGLIIGAVIAISFAGLVYLYVIKIVEPRMVKWHDTQTVVQVNWLKANWELMAIVVTFLVVTTCIIFIPYNNTATELGVLSVGMQTRFAILIFTAICLVGGTSFAYGIRSRGLIETSRHLEKVLRRLKGLIACCSGPLAPELYNDAVNEHSNIIQHVLKQLAFKATVNKEEAYYRSQQNKEKHKNWFEKLFGAGNTTPRVFSPEPVHAVTETAPWEERYHPQIIDELRAAEFEYLEQKARFTKCAVMVGDYRDSKQSERKLLEDELQACYKGITEMETAIEAIIGDKGKGRLDITNEYNKLVVDLLDGFHLGLWYRENGLGPTADFFEANTPVSPLPASLISAQ